VSPPRVEYKGFKYKPLRKGHVTKALVVRTAKEILYKDGSTVSFFENAGILIKKKKTAANYSCDWSGVETA
jgi:ribosomal protein L14